MSTMYYALPDNRPIGQVHSLGKDKGYHFTWCMFPLEFARQVGGVVRSGQTWIADEHGNMIDFFTLQDIIIRAESQSFDERIV